MNYLSSQQNALEKRIADRVPSSIKLILAESN